MLYKAMAAAILLVSAANAGAETSQTTGSTTTLQDQDWTGVYIGISSGSAMSKTTGGFVDLEGDGQINGLQIGVDQDFGSFVLGAAVEHLSTDVELYVAPFPSVNVASFSLLKLRGGLDLGRTLPYVTTGISRVEIEDIRTGGGTFIGGGAEFLVTPNFSIGLEMKRHRHQDFNSTTTSDWKMNSTTTQLSAGFRF
ncbi:MAG: outer membrane beta-barrel protein [Pseudomonadota bacterium]|nr:outer membrane beta-barrel protein [Pseudomonadota bacterium]